MVATIHRNTLLHFRFNPEYTAQRGRHGEGSNRTGHDGESITVQVPVGTVVSDAETGEKLFDFTEDGQTWLAAKAGRGGRGNARFTSSTHQAPTEHEPGKPGEFKTLRLELKLLADVGLVGYPNAGWKSTLISRISAARSPRLQIIHSPRLNQIWAWCSCPMNAAMWWQTFPGSLKAHTKARGSESSSSNTWKERRFLRIWWTCRKQGEIRKHDFETLMTELEKFSEDMAKKPMLVVASKMDVSQDPKKVAALKRLAKKLGLPFFEISSATGQGIEELKFALAEHVLCNGRSSGIRITPDDNMWGDGRR